MKKTDTSVKVMWLGQAGFFFEFENFKLMIDPYLSNSVAKVEPLNSRRYPMDERCFELQPDAVLCTHNHLDHFDAETLIHFIKKEELKYCMGPTSVWTAFRQLASDLGVTGKNIIRFNRHAEWSFHDVLIKAVKADHSDPDAIGILMEYRGKRFYITGDTLYNTEIFNDVCDNVDIVFLPVNGVGNNMNAMDAVRFAERIGAKTAVPVHFGLFDSMDGSEFEYKNSMILEHFKEYIF